MSFLSAFKNFFVNLGKFFTSPKTAEKVNKVLSLVLKVLPVIMYAAKLGAKVVTPLDPADDLLLENLSNKFPSLFTGQPKNSDEQKLRLMLIAEEILKAKYPNLSTTELRILVNAAYQNLKDAPQAVA